MEISLVYVRAKIENNLNILALKNFFWVLLTLTGESRGYIEKAYNEIAPGGGDGGTRVRQRKLWLAGWV